MSLRGEPTEWTEDDFAKFEQATGENLRPQSPHSGPTRSSSLSTVLLELLISIKRACIWTLKIVVALAFLAALAVAVVTNWKIAFVIIFASWAVTSIARSVYRQEREKEREQRQPEAESEEPEDTYTPPAIGHRHFHPEDPEYAAMPDAERLERVAWENARLAGRSYLKAEDYPNCR